MLLRRSASRRRMAQLSPANALPTPSEGRLGRLVSAWTDRHFKWLMVAPAALLILALSIYPLLFSLWVNFVNYDFQIPGHDFVGLENFSQVVARSVGRFIAGPDGSAVAHRGRHRVRARTSACARHGEDLPRPRRHHVDPDHTAVHQPGDRRPVLGAVPATAFRPCRLSARPAARPSRQDQLGRRGSLGLYRHRHRRCLAMDPVHVRHPARRPRGDSTASLRGGRARWDQQPVEPSST